MLPQPMTMMVERRMGKMARVIVRGSQRESSKAGEQPAQTVQRRRTDRNEGRIFTKGQRQGRARRGSL